MGKERKKKKEPLGVDLGLMRETLKQAGIKGVDTEILDTPAGFHPHLEKTLDAHSKLLDARIRIVNGDGTKDDYELVSLLHLPIK